jgi:polyisoprenoid-binding protein YceI
MSHRFTALRCAQPLAAVVLVLCCTSSMAAEENFRLDPVHTRVAFQVSHAGFSQPVGSFSKVQGELSFDPDNWKDAKLTVRIPITTLDLGDADWQARILDATFFDAKRYPEAVFTSTSVEPVDATHARVTGTFQMHGASKPVTLDVTLNALKRHPLTFKRTAGFSATGLLHRSDFGMDKWKTVVGDEVRLIIEAEAVHTSAKGEPDAAAQ